MTGNVSRVIAGCFALAAFATAIVAGLTSGNGASAVLVRASIALIICYPVGLVIGAICQRIVNEYVRTHCQTHPRQQSPSGGEAASGQKSAETGRSEDTVLEA
ncbi:MAG: hypothetical protein JSV91_11815 [Phycisphaerales bacterium]|nr:MAG: hypothetical protein JSV91_11815 [Phycisphaerales bacterium]